MLNPVSVFASQSSEPAPVEKRGPGRPPGSKNKPKEVDAMSRPSSSILPSSIPPVKKARGRKKGSKNKPKEVPSSSHPSVQEPCGQGTGRGRGRGRGLGGRGGGPVPTSWIDESYAARDESVEENNVSSVER